MARPAGTTIEQFSPELADLLVDQSLRTLGKGSSREVVWRCPDHLDDERHVYSAYVGNKTASKDPLRCNICTGKCVVTGINDIATTHPEAVPLFVDQHMPTTLTAKSNKKAEFWCGDPQHAPWTGVISNVVAIGTRCGQCSGRRATRGADDLATTHPAIAAMLVDQSRASLVKAGSSSTPETWRCPQPGHPDWEETPYAVVRAKTPCPTCNGRLVVAGVNDLATTHPALAQQMKDQQLATQISKGHCEDVDWICPTDRSHVWPASPNNRTKGVGCRICANKMIVAGYNDIATTAPQLVDLLLDPLDATRYPVGTGTKLAWRCPVDATHDWRATPSRFLSPRPPGCSQCFKNGRSGPEAELVEAIKTLLPGEEVLTGDRSVLGTHELDIVVRHRKIAFEFNGVYWHSEAQQPSTTYHADKSRLAAQKGYRLVHVWEDDWFDRREIVVRGIAHRLGVGEHVLSALPDADPAIAQKAYARILVLGTATGPEARAFWQANHLQGPVGSKHYFALRDKSTNQIKALLGIGATNHGSRAKADPGVWDVQRYATRGVVPGGFTRLLKHATDQLRASGHVVNTWTSFSNDDVSDGGMYRAAGFATDKHQAPSYWYVGTLTGWRRTHRTQFVKQRFVTDDALLYEDGWTEHEAALANRLYRIYDAGKTRWVKHV